jgi:hypothetical protein
MVRIIGDMLDPLGDAIGWITTIVVLVFALMVLFIARWLW